MDKNTHAKNYRIDSDGDGLSDYEEIYIYGTDPYDPDTDGDGMSDGDEVKVGRNPAGPGTLRDLFIPHAGNDYKPHALKPKRIALYAISVLVVKVIVVGSALMLPISAWLSPDMAVTEGKRIIQLTNEVRNDVNVEPLVENPILTRAAFRKAEDMVIKQYFAHTGPDKRSLANWLKDASYDYKVAGENLAMGFANAEDVVEAWKKSKTHYQNLIDPEFSEIGVSIAGGTFEGFDTTFVAQFFGQQKASNIQISPEQEQFLAPISEIISTSTEITADISVDNSPKHEVLPAKLETSVTVMEPISLPVPSLLSPNDDHISKENIVDMKILAPNSDKVTVLIDSKSAGTSIVTNDEATVSVYLEEGVSDVEIVSEKDGVTAISPVYIFTIDKTAPQIDDVRTHIEMKDVEGQDARAITANVALSDDTDSAYLNFDNYRVELAKSDIEQNMWSGSAVIFTDIDPTAIRPMTLPTITARDNLGNETTADVSWTSFTPTNATLLDQYQYQKENPSSFMKPLFGFSELYYRILLILAILFLLINILVQVRKQHPHILLSAIGFITLTTLLLII